LTTTGLGQALATGLGQALTIAAARQVARHGLLALLVAGEAPQPLVRTLSSFGRRKGVLPRGVLDADTLGGARLRSYLAELRSPCRLLGPPPPPPRGACVRSSRRRRRRRRRPSISARSVVHAAARGG
jgi:hypothetical protein